jgi:hypothetical protein
MPVMTSTDTHKPAADAAMSPTGLDIDNDHADERPIDRSQDAPEAHNREQDDEAAQAQSVADDAIRGKAATQIASEDSEHGGTTNPAQIEPDDAQDVVDHMEQMESSGIIDMDAYRGERNDDDEAEMLGEGGMEPGDLDEHGNPRRGADEQFTPVE